MTQIEITQTKEGVLHTITSPAGLEYTTQIAYNGQPLLALEVYEATGDFNTEYLLFPAGQPVKHLTQLGKAYPTLLKDPQGEILVSLEKTIDGKRKHYTSKLFQGEVPEQGTITKRFGEGLLGFIDNSGYYLSGNRLQRVDFQDGKVTVHRNKIYKSFTKGLLDKEHIHILREEPDTVLIQEVLDQNYKVVNSRTFEVPAFEQLEIINLSIDQTSRFITVRPESKEFELWTIDVNNNVSTQVLMSLNSEIYTLFEPVPLYSGAVLFRFVAEDQNGWFIVKEDKLLECFVEKDTGYQSILDDRFIHLGADNWVLAGANPTVDNGYAVAFYPSMDDIHAHADKVILLLRDHE